MSMDGFSITCININCNDLDASIMRRIRKQIRIEFRVDWVEPHNITICGLVNKFQLVLKLIMAFIVYHR